MSVPLTVLRGTAPVGEVGVFATRRFEQASHAVRQVHLEIAQAQEILPEDAIDAVSR
jgi:hypothetical protein